MIEPTDEMCRAFRGAISDGSGYRQGIAAVLAIVERDYRVVPCRTGEQGRCQAVRFSADNAGLCASIGCVYPGRPSSTWTQVAP